jgi:hypothetical protein
MRAAATGLIFRQVWEGWLGGGFAQNFQSTNAMHAILANWQTAWALIAGHRRFLVRGRASRAQSRYACTWGKNQQDAMRRFARQYPDCEDLEVLGRL